MKRYIVYTQDRCKYCTLAKQLLELRGLPFAEKNLSEPNFRLEALEQGFRTMPQIIEVSGGVYRLIGGYTELAKEFGVIT